jgi:Holliday junction resolvase
LFLIILRYDKANWDNIKSDLEDTLKKIITINNDAKSTVNEMWNLFKNNLTKSINKNIPHKKMDWLLE